MGDLSLYIHIPFCARKCLYCDFLSFPVDLSYVNSERQQRREKEANLPADGARVCQRLNYVNPKTAEEGRNAPVSCGTACEVGNDVNSEKRQRAEKDEKLPIGGMVARQDISYVNSKKQTREPGRAFDSGKSYVNYKNEHSAPQTMTGAEVENYVNLLCREIALRGSDYKKYRVISIFLGGGTPSLLSGTQTARILAALRASFQVAEDAEITLECNPGTATAGKFSQYITCGINRLSIGLQSADEGELARIGRIHGYEDFCETYRLARAAGFSNINVDLMAALPGQTFASYRNTLERVAALSPEHISAYSLMLEEGTPLYVNQSDYAFPDEEEDRAMYALTGELLAAAGYQRYEISNYAKPGRECRHNMVYWRRGNYLGLGLGASSLVGNLRWKNPEGFAAYGAYVAARAGGQPVESEAEWPLRGVGQISGQPSCGGKGLPADGEAQLAGALSCEIRETVEELAARLKNSGCYEVQILTQKEQMEEFMFLGLRLTEGVAEEAFERAFGLSLESVYGEALRKLSAQGLLLRAKGRLWLTQRGLDLSNIAFVEFLL